MKKGLVFVSVLAAVLFGACSVGTSNDDREDAEAKKLLQGLWLDSETSVPILKAQGDTIYYADSTLVPAKFKIVDDSLILYVADQRSSYHVVELKEHIFKFISQSQDTIRLVKDDGEEPIASRKENQPIALNQGVHIKRDTVVYVSNEKIHSYVNVSPTTYKVYINTYNQDGVEVSTVYYDNIVNLTVYSGNRRLYGKDFKKQDFAGYVPNDFISNSILSDIELIKTTPQSVLYQACLAIPDGNVSFRVNMEMTPSGKMTISSEK